MKFIEDYKINEADTLVVYRGLKFHLSVVMKSLTVMRIMLTPDSKTLDKIRGNISEWGEGVAKHMSKKMGIDVNYSPDSDSAGLDFTISTFELADIIKKVI